MATKKEDIREAVERVFGGLNEAPGKVTVQFYDDKAEGREVYDMTPTITKLYPVPGSFNDLLEKVGADVRANKKLQKTKHLFIDFVGYLGQKPASSDASKKLTSIVGKPVVASYDGEVDMKDLETIDGLSERLVREDVESYFTSDFKFDVTFNRNGELNSPGQRTLKSPAEVERFLEADAMHIVVLHGSKDKLFGNVKFNPELYIMRGGDNSSPKTYYWGEMPAEDPGDANRVDGGAAEAMRDATEEYYQ